MQISGHNNVAFINNYSTLSEERHKKISNILSNTESETNRNAFQQTYLVKPPQILQPVALLMFRVEAIPMFLFTVPMQICQVKLVLCFTAWSSISYKWWMCTQFSQMTKYPNNWAFECLTSLLNTFPWISSVCWDKWLIFLFSLLYLVYLKHARIVYTCMCVLLSHVYKLCGSYLNTPAVVTRQIYTPVSYKGGRLQLYGSFLFIFF